MLPPRLTAVQCADLIERERLTMILALRAGFVCEARECARFIARMAKHLNSARWYEKCNP